MTDHRAWAKMLAEKALARFGARVWFMGLQGSVRRGAATESSDIDFVLILDRLDTADLSDYRELVRSMPDSEKACACRTKNAALYSAGRLAEASSNKKL